METGSDAEFYKKQIAVLDEKVKMLSVSRNEEKCRNTLLSAIPDMVFLMNKQGDYIDYRGGRGVLFINEDHLIGSNIYESTMSKEVIDRIMQANNLAIDTDIVQEIEYELVFPDGNFRMYESRSAKYDENHVVRIVREITSRVALERELRSYVQTLEKNSFDLSHQVRLHLSNIMGLTELILPAQHDSKMNVILEQLKESAKKLDQSITTMSQEINLFIK